MLLITSSSLSSAVEGLWKSVWERSMSKGHCGLVHPRRLRSIKPMIIFDLRFGVMNRSTFLLFWSLLRRIHRLVLPEMGIFLPSAYLKLGSCHSVSLSTFQPLLSASASSSMLYLEPVSRVILSWELARPA